MTDEKGFNGNICSPPPEGDQDSLASVLETYLVVHLSYTVHSWNTAAAAESIFLCAWMIMITILPHFGGLLLSDLQESQLIFLLLLPNFVLQQLWGSLHLLHVTLLDLDHILTGQQRTVIRAIKSTQKVSSLKMLHLGSNAVCNL